MITQARIESAHLAGNLLGDPSERDVYIYLLRDTEIPTAGTPRRTCSTPSVLPPIYWSSRRRTPSVGRHRSKMSSIPYSGAWGLLR